MPARVRPLLWLLALAIAAFLIYKTRPHRDMVDFGVYRVAATRALAAEPLYREEDGHYKFKYLPAFAMAMAPFAALEPGTAKAVWFALSVGLLVVFVCWSIAALPDRRSPKWLLASASAVLMAKFYGHELTLGQTNILLGVVLVAALLAAGRKQRVAAGALAGLAVFVKPYAIILLPWVLGSCGVGAALASMGVVLAGLVLPTVIYGWSGNLDLLASWYRLVTGSTASTLVGNDTVSLAGMWGKWLGVGTTATVLAMATGVALLGLVVAVWLRRRTVRSPEYVEVAMLMLLVPLLSPQGWDYVLLLATPAVVVLVDRWKDVNWVWRGLTAATLVVMGLTIYDVMGRELYGRFMALSLVSVSAIVATILLAHLRWKAVG